MNIFERHESEVRSSCRSCPAVFESAKGAWMTDENGKRYLDFFAGAGVLNYGHNPDQLKKALIDYMSADGITHALDMYTTAKRRFIERFQEVILEPRSMNYKLQFPGPTGTNAVESALKLARKVTGRERMVSFTTGNGFKRAGAGVPLNNTLAVPFEGYLGDETDTLDYLARMLEDDGSGLDTPAAVIVETVQAEGGINVASIEWLRRLREVTREHDVLLIIDDIQVGCGRTGKFFSFEDAGIQPDMITLSKSLSGYGLPFALLLIQPEHDQWAPGEHNGTFRGHNPAFITGAAALDFWADDSLEKAILAKEKIAVDRLNKMVEKTKVAATVRGRGLIQGVAFEDTSIASKVSAEAFKNGLIIETAGVADEVLKLLPSLTISEEELAQGLDIIEHSLNTVLKANTRDAA